MQSAKRAEQQSKDNTLQTNRFVDVGIWKNLEAHVHHLRKRLHATRHGQTDPSMHMLFIFFIKCMHLTNRTQFGVRIEALRHHQE
jgi:hypothetical protein